MACAHRLPAADAWSTRSACSSAACDKFDHPWVARRLLGRAHRLDARHAAQGRLGRPLHQALPRADLTVAAHRHPAHRRSPTPTAASGPTLPSIWTAGSVLAFAIKGGWRWARLRVRPGRRRQHRRARRSPAGTPCTTCCWSGSPASPSATSSRWPAPVSAPSPAPCRSRPPPGSASGWPATSTTACSRSWRWCSAAARRSAARPPSWAGWRGSRRSRCAPWSPAVWSPPPRVSDGRRAAAPWSGPSTVDDGRPASADDRAICGRCSPRTPGPGSRFAEPGAPVLLPRAAARELAAAVSAALDNVRQARGATDAQAWILVEDEPDEVIVTVRDDGPGHPGGPARAGGGRGPAGRRPLDPRAAARPGRQRRADLGAGPGHGGRAEGSDEAPRRQERADGTVGRRSDDRTDASEADRAATGQGDGRRRPPDVAGRGRPRSGRGRVRRGGHRRRRPAGRAPRPRRRARRARPRPQPARACRASRSARSSSAPTPALRVLVLSASGEHADVLEAVKSGATGYLLKSASTEELTGRGAPHGRRRPGLHPGPRRAGARRVPQAGRRARARRRRRRAEGPAAHRARDRGAAAGRQGALYKQIAERLVISHRTVQNHVQNTLGKLQLHNRVELVRYAIERGLDDA